MSIEGNHRFSYAVIADTHLNQNEHECNSPFEVNQLANARLRWVIEDLNTRDISHVVHLGDVVHPVPSMGDLYSDSAARFNEQTAPLRHPLFVVPGNHDVGDKPIKWGPAGTVRQSFLDAWQQYFGDHYFAHEHEDVLFIGINAQVIGSSLPLEIEQQRWLETTLEQNHSKRVALFTHYPPFLLSDDEDEHYDNLGEQGRTALLALIRKYKIEALFAGHVHHFWYNRWQDCDCFLLPSTCFTRQDYAEMFRVGPAAEYGRNDADKLGYFLVHVYEQGQQIEMVRSFGRARTPDDAAPSASPSPSPTRQLPPVNATTNGQSLMGFDLRHDWCEKVQIPPSGGLEEFDRKWVRNDYGLLALWEMGVRRLRVPVADLADSERRSRLHDLARLGFRFTLYSFDQPDDALLALVLKNAELFDSWEIGFQPDDRSSLSKAALAPVRQAGVKLFASPLRSKAEILSTGKKYYHVVNHGFTSADQGDDGSFSHPLIDENFGDLFDGAVFRCGLNDDMQQILDLTRELGDTPGIESVIHLRLTADNPAEYQMDDARVAKRLCETMLMSWACGGRQLICDSLIDNDRGYFPRVGVLDRLYNPKQGFHVVKGLHSLLNMAGECVSLEPAKGSATYVARSATHELMLPGPQTGDEAASASGFGSGWSWLHWRDGSLSEVQPDDDQRWPLIAIRRRD